MQWVQGLKTAPLLKTDFNTGISLSILRNFKEHLRWLLQKVFCSYTDQAFFFFLVSYLLVDEKTYTITHVTLTHFFYPFKKRILFFAH